MATTSTGNMDMRLGMEILTETAQTVSVCLHCFDPSAKFLVCFPLFFSNQLATTTSIKYSQAVFDLYKDAVQRSLRKCCSTTSEESSLARGRLITSHSCAQEEHAGIPPWRIRHTAPTSRLEALPFSPMVKDVESAMMYVMDRLVSHYLQDPK